MASNLAPNISLIKLQFEVIIRKLFLQNTPDEINFQVLWVRGGKKIDTRCKQSSDGSVKIGDKFQMKTSLEFDTLTNQFVNKPVSFFAPSTSCLLACV